MDDHAQVSINDADGAIVATVGIADMAPGVINALMQKTQDLAGEGRPAMLVVDLAKVKFIDSVALGSLVVLLRRVKATEGRLAMVGLGGHSLKVLQVTGLDKVFDLFEDVPSALEELRRPV